MSDDLTAFIADLREKRDKAEARVRRTKANHEAAVRDFEELDCAYTVLIKHGYIKDAAGHEPAGAAMNETQALVLSCVPYGEVFAIAPKDVANMLHARGRDDITADYVRTTLWRLAKREILKSEGGLYWRPGKPDLENVAAPDAETSRAGNGRVGPHGGGTGWQLYR